MPILPQKQDGFTIMEIVVATTIFAVTVSSMMALMDYTLKINRRAEALRQATQGMRNLVEFLVKEIRNGQIDYSVENGNLVLSPVGACPGPSSATVGSPTNGNASYRQEENRIGIVSLKGERECIYLANSSGSYESNVFSGPGRKLMLKKENIASVEDLMPQNFSVEEARFYIRPLKDPYAATGGYALIQPFVTMVIKFKVDLPTRESVVLYYQTSVSTNKYDIPK